MEYPWYCIPLELSLNNMFSFYFWVRFANATLSNGFEVFTLLGRRMPRIVDGFRPPRGSKYSLWRKIRVKPFLVVTGNQRACATI